MTNLELSRVARVLRAYHKDIPGLPDMMAEALELKGNTLESFLKACRDARYANVSGKAP